MDKSQKIAFVSSLHEELKSAGTLVVSHYRGLTVAEMSELRAGMREEGGKTIVAKNRLAKIAFKDTDFEGLESLMTGPTVLTYSEDPIAAAKAAQKFADKHKDMVILGGSMGTNVLDQAGVKALATMPSLDELRAKIVGLINAPATKVATLSQEPAAKLARVLAMKQDAA